MKIRLLIIASVLTTLSAAAQDTEREQVTPKRIPGKNEIGFFAEIFNGNSWYNSNYAATAGLQYKRWAKPNIAYRIMGSMGHYSQQSDAYFRQKRNDTVFQTQNYANIPMYFGGGGVEVQRHFYKKVTLYAAIELKAGYGAGTSEEVEIQEVQQANYPYGGPIYHHQTNTLRTNNVTAFVMDVTPFVGAKLNFKRLSLGTEVSIVRAGLEKVNYENIPDFSTGNFDASNFRQRLYLNYRF